MQTKLLLMFMATACSPMVYTHGVPNFAQVSPGVYRSGQIETQEGWDYIHTIAAGRKVHVIKLNFANEGSDMLGAAMGFEILELGVQPEGDQDVWDDLQSVFLGPDPTRVNTAEDMLAYCADHARTDVCLGHCTHGQDRTGYLFGRYRVQHDHWTKAHAYTEMRAHNFHPELHGIHEAWESFRAP